MMTTYWLQGETVEEAEDQGDVATKEADNSATELVLNHDEGIDDIEEITFTFHVSDHDKDKLEK